MTYTTDYKIGQEVYWISPRAVLLNQGKINGIFIFDSADGIKISYNVYKGPDSKYSVTLSSDQLYGNEPAALKALEAQITADAEKSLQSAYTDIGFLSDELEKAKYRFCKYKDILKKRGADLGIYEKLDVD